MRFDLWNCESLDAARLRDVVCYFSAGFLTFSPRARACSGSARVIGARAGLVRLRGKRVQKFGPHEHALRMGSDWPLMAIWHSSIRIPREVR
jgi:hypothetical protein